MRLTLAVSLVSLGLLSSSVFATGLHSGLGQKAGLNVDVQFLNPSGHTYTDVTGIHYNLWDYYLINETLYYKSSTWGQLFPLFFLGQTVNYTATITNIAPGKKSYRIRLVG